PPTATLTRTIHLFYTYITPPPPTSTLFPYTTLFRSIGNYSEQDIRESARAFTGYRLDLTTQQFRFAPLQQDRLTKTFMGRTGAPDRKSTRLNSSHQIISYAVFCLKKKKKTKNRIHNN